MGLKKAKEKRLREKQKRESTPARPSGPQSPRANRRSAFSPARLQDRIGPEINQRWKNKLACSKLCVKLKFSFGTWISMLRYLQRNEQTCLQLLSRWVYEIGVPRAQSRNYSLSVFYFPWKKGILKLNASGWSNEVAALKSDIDSEGWSSFQIRHHIFQVQEKNGSCRWLQNMGFSQFGVHKKSPLGSVRAGASFCKMTDQYIFATGGKTRYYLTAVSRYDITKDTWKDMPGMNVARMSHGSCTIGSTVYIACGMNQQDGYLNSIEKLETKDPMARWQLIQMPHKNRLDRLHWPVVAALNTNEILIMGGRDDYLQTVASTFDTKQNSLQKAIKNAPFPLIAFKDGAVQVRPGVVIALVQDSNKDFKLIQYKSNGSITQLYSVID